MARPIEQIEQDLTNLRTASRDIGVELTTAYKSYFTALAQTLKQQSIQACYYLTTTCYPEAFLRLSYNQRSQLLKTLQRVIQNVVADLAIHMDTPSQNSDDDDNEPTGELTAFPPIPIDWFANPESLLTWQKQIESEIIHTLKEISYKGNLLLQQAQILPAAIPKPVLEAHPQADERGSNPTKVPNLLCVFIEQGSNSGRTMSSFLQSRDYADRQEQELDEDPAAVDPLMGGSDRSSGNLSEQLDEEDNTPKILQIQSLYLRLIEIEFADASVLSSRKNINQLVNKVKTLRRDYLQKQQELIIAEAEAAWRHSWFED
jgi:hypothetical protein